MAGPDWDTTLLAGGIFALLTDSGTPPDRAIFKSCTIAGAKILLERLDGEEFEIAVTHLPNWPKIDGDWKPCPDCSGQWCTMNCSSAPIERRIHSNGNG